MDLKNSNVQQDRVRKKQGYRAEQRDIARNNGTGSSTKQWREQKKKWGGEEKEQEEQREKEGPGLGHWDGKRGTLNRTETEKIKILIGGRME